MPTLTQEDAKTLAHELLKDLAAALRCDGWEVRLDSNDHETPEGDDISVFLRVHHSEEDNVLWWIAVPEAGDGEYHNRATAGCVSWQHDAPSVSYLPAYADMPLERARLQLAGPDVIALTRMAFLAADFAAIERWERLGYAVRGQVAFGDKRGHFRIGGSADLDFEQTEVALTALKGGE